MTTAPDPPSDAFNLERFTKAQGPVWDGVLAELRAGRKDSHWMWFVFPQLATLGRSPTAKHFGLSGLAEARAFLAHPVLGPRLLQAAGILLQVPPTDAVAIFGNVDAMKLRSCLTLFAAAAPQQRVFADCLDRYFGGATDEETVRALA